MGKKARNRRKKSSETLPTPTTAENAENPRSWARIAFYSALGALLAALLGNRASPQRQRNSVLVLAQGRSGSTFLASFWRMHPELLYVIEPCASPFVWPNSDVDYTGRKCFDTVVEIFDCDFQSVQPKLTKYQRLGEHGDKGFDGWGNRSQVDTCSVDREGVVVKEIRLAGVLDSFSDEELLEMLSTVRSIVGLVRDPRNVLSSRLKGWMEPDEFDESDISNNPPPFNPKTRHGNPYAQSVRGLCHDHLALRSLAKRLKHKMVLFEYLELKKDPLRVLEKAFEFTKTSFSDDVVEHVKRSTMGKCEHKDQPFSVCREHLKSSDVKDEKYKTELPKEYLEQMLDIPECVEAIGYYESK